LLIGNTCCETATKVPFSNLFSLIKIEIAADCVNNHNIYIKHISLNVTAQKVSGISPLQAGIWSFYHLVYELIPLNAKIFVLHG
jgi:hypothetical protein